VRPSHEAQVAKRFEIREIESYLPQYQVEHRWKNRCTKTLGLPLFPGYIFAHISPTERIRVLGVPTVLFIVGTAGRRIPLPICDIDALRARLVTRSAGPHLFLKVGEHARIRRGALAGMEGVVLRRGNNLRVVISLDLIMQSVVVEVDWDELEPVAIAVACAPRELSSSGVSTLNSGRIAPQCVETPLRGLRP
jgi:transcription antitermination factor NusG